MWHATWAARNGAVRLQDGAVRGAGSGGTKPVSKIGKVYYCVRKIAWYLTLPTRTTPTTATITTTATAAISCYFHATFVFVSHTPLPYLTVVVAVVLLVSPVLK